MMAPLSLSEWRPLCSIPAASDSTWSLSLLHAVSSSPRGSAHLSEDFVGISILLRQIRGDFCGGVGGFLELCIRTNVALGMPSAQGKRCSSAQEERCIRMGLSSARGKAKRSEKSVLSDGPSFFSCVQSATNLGSLAEVDRALGAR